MGILVPPYYRSISYELTEDEVVVRKGIVTKVVKTVPYRTITNTVVARDLFDRGIFNLGSVLIQTAGMSGTSGYEESLVGLTDWDGAHQQVMNRLRRFRLHAMSPTQSGPEGVVSVPSRGSGLGGEKGMAVSSGEASGFGNGETAGKILEELKRIRIAIEKSPPDSKSTG